MADELNPNLGPAPMAPPPPAGGLGGPSRPPVSPTPPPVPPVKPRVEDFSVRTMAGDLQAPRPLTTERSDVGQAKPSEVMPPEKGPTPPPLSPETNVMSSMIEEEPPQPKKWLYLVIGLVVVVILAAVGYFFIYPLFTTPETPTTATPLSGDQPIASLSHQSYFVSAPAVSAEIRLSRVDLSEITFALQIESLKPVADGSVKELVMLDTGGDQIPFHDYFGALAPVVDHMALAQLLENDFTAFLYYNADGIWPGYVAKIKSSVDVPQLRSQLAGLETADLSALFITAGGNLSGFKDGVVNSFPARYTSGSTPGAAFSYTILDDNFVLFSTSYAGAQQAAEMLGFSR